MDWMDAITQSKFDAWDEVVRCNVLEIGTDEERAGVYRMLRDPTIYFYAWFKDDNGNRFKAYSYQDIIINDPNDRIIFAASNQIGKSYSLCMKALHHALTHPSHTVLMVSKTLPQSKDLLRQIKRMMQNSTLSYKTSIGDTETKTEISFTHEDDLEDGSKRILPPSRIICVPATEAALGYAAHLVLIDELAFYENGDYFYRQIIQPRTYSTKGQIIVFSNPNGRMGIFWELWNDPRFSKYNFNYLDKPGNTQEEFERLSHGLSREEIDSTLLAVFTDAEGSFLTTDERAAMFSKRPNCLPLAPEKGLSFFFDFAKVHDHTVRICAEEIGDITSPSGVYVHEIKEYPLGTSYTDIVSDFEQVVSSYPQGKVYRVGWDNTGVGAGIDDFMRRVEGRGVQCIPVKFSLENKSRMYTVLKMLIERNLRKDEFGNMRVGISLPLSKRADDQFATLRFKRSAGGHLQVHHLNEKDLDDIPDATAGMCGLLVHPDVFPSSLNIVEHDDKHRCPSCREVIAEDDNECPHCHFDIDKYLGIV
jgi:hypothetical protein